ncbi:hypothetical protein N7535_002048 [Penicillium sp. DV-2018c]|nr:hypothetical protein N7461_004708 [Penicillium sp. DV-2018c]KAJ5583428.1 hypothetical protein N7535_002048 [Penicillium sp. DV-2018c]
MCCETQRTPPPEDSCSCNSDESFLTAPTHLSSDIIDDSPAGHLASAVSVIRRTVRLVLGQSAGSVSSRQPSTAVRHPAPRLGPTRLSIRDRPAPPTSVPATMINTVGSAVTFHAIIHA